MKRRVLIIAQVEYEDQSSGVTKKVLSQKEAMNSFADEVHCLCYYHGHPALVRSSKEIEELSVKISQLRRVTFWHHIKSIISVLTYDIIYIRYSYIDLFALKALKWLKQKHSRIVLEIPTYPLVNEKLSGTERMLYLSEKIFGRNVGKYIDRILYIGDKTEQIWGKSAIQIPNGLPYGSQIIEKTGFNYDNKTIRIIAVSIMAYSHGYDRLIKALCKYKKNKEEHMPQIELYLVGDGEYKEEYEKIAKECGVMDLVFFPGFLSGKGLTEMYRRATVGAGCFGLFRNGHNESSTLKIKEYLLRGLPYINASKEIGIPEDFEYHLTFSNDDCEIDLKKVVEFVEKMKLIGKQDIIHGMNMFAETNLSWEKIFRESIYDLFK